MKRTFIIGGGILLLAGSIWLLQGIGILPGSFMSGQSFWAWAGLVSLMAGIVLLFLGLTRRTP
jgi:hypothetical protein